MPVEPVVRSEAEQARLDQAMAAAQASFDNGKYEEAKRRTSRIIGLAPDSYDSRLLLGETLLKLRQPEQAISQFTSGVASEPHRARALQGIGLSLLRLGDEKGALENLQKAVGLDSSLWRAYNALGLVHDKKQDWQFAELNYRRAAAVAEKPESVLNNLGMSYMLQKRYPESAIAFRQALERDPHLATAKSNLRLALASQGKYIEALAGVPQEKLPDVLNDVGYLAMMRGDYDNAEAYLSRAMAISPSYHVTAASNLQSLETLRSQSY